MTKVVQFEEELLERERAEHPDDRSDFEKEFPAFTRAMKAHRDDPVIRHAYAHSTMTVEMYETRRFNEMVASRKFFNKSITHICLHQRLVSAMCRAFMNSRSSYVEVQASELEERLKRVETYSAARVKSIIREALDAGWVRESVAGTGDGIAYYLSPEVFFWWMSISGRDYQSIQSAVEIGQANDNYAEHLDELEGREPPVFEALRSAYEKDCDLSIDFRRFSQR
tara:strand:- start:833 stop:1507 length:675 start_codon:yes stop_codon:yes gene_type:complete